MLNFNKVEPQEKYSCLGSKQLIVVCDLLFRGRKILVSVVLHKCDISYCYIIEIDRNCVLLSIKICKGNWQETENCR